MKFESVRCDECKRIQDGVNHWEKAIVWKQGTDVLGLTLGIAVDETFTNQCYRKTEDVSMPKITQEIHDLCGQACAVKHLGKLLGWSVTAGAEAEQPR